MIKKSIVIITSIFISCSRESMKTDYYPNGNVRSEVATVNNLKQGEELGYFETGEVAWIRWYRNDTLEGPAIHYYTNGKPDVEGFFKKGKQSGLVKLYYQSGRLKVMENYTNGIPNGLRESYYLNGKVKMSGYSRSGQPEYYTEFDSLGNIIDKKHHIYFHILNELNTEDSIKIMVGIPGFIATPDKKMSKGWVSTSIQKYGLISEGTMPQMKYNKIDSCYYHVFPPVGETGSYLINIVFFC
jgi:hypothetical protein